MSCRWNFWEYERMVWIPCLHQCLQIAKFGCLFFRKQCSWCSWVEHSRVTGQAYWASWRGAVLPLIDAFHGKNIKWITSAHEQFATQFFQTMIADSQLSSWPHLSSWTIIDIVNWRIIANNCQWLNIANKPLAIICHYLTILTISDNILMANIGKCCKGAVAIQLQPTPSLRASLVLWRPESIFFSPNRVKLRRVISIYIYMYIYIYLYTYIYIYR